MSLMHNIRNFAEIQLQGVIPWSKFSFPDEVHTDTANVSIEGKGGLYRISVTSSYAAPPLGNVKFVDHGNGHEIEGNNQDGTWHFIAEYLKARERGEESLEAKRAAWNDEAQNEAKSYLNSLAETRVVPLPANQIAIPPVPMVYYIADPGVWYQNGPALVTRINADGSYNLTVMPDGSEPFYRQNVKERSDDLRNVCWASYPGAAPNFIEVEVPYQSAEIEALRVLVTELQDTISRLKASAFDQRKSA